MTSMTDTTSTTTTPCPPWCAQGNRDNQEVHGEVHASPMTYIARPGDLLFVEVQSAYLEPLAGRHLPWVAICREDDELLHSTPAEMRSLAAALVAAAALAEGVRRG